jgi:hypothetical protein
MHQIIVESALGQTLGALDGQAVLCDGDGRALGFFSPLQTPTRIDDLQLEPPLSIAETEALRSVRTGKPLNEILTRLNVQ